MLGLELTPEGIVAFVATAWGAGLLVGLLWLTLGLLIPDGRSSDDY